MCWSTWCCTYDRGSTATYTLVKKKSCHRLFDRESSQKILSCRSISDITLDSTEVLDPTRSLQSKEGPEKMHCMQEVWRALQMPLMPQLPKKRVNESAPFTNTGVDYFGPIYVKAENGSEKVWVCLYTCLVVRAIHMEIMLDM